MTIARTASDIALIVREARQRQGLRQEDLALVAGTGRRFVIDLEAGKPTARLGDVLKVVGALGLEIEIHERPPTP